MIFPRLREQLRLNIYYKYCFNQYSTQLLSDFPVSFKPKDVEHNWYNIWEENKYFIANENEKEALKMLLPPPNITGTLHLGHALTVTIQDVLARWHRMKGHPVIWIPGFDHAGIATQMIVEKYLFKTKNITRYDMRKEELLSFILEWKSKKEDVIKSQLKALGASLDWSREYFTMSQSHNNAVTEAFITLSKQDLLYRKKDLINWSPTLRSTISDIEVKHLYIDGKTQLEVPGYKKKIAFGEIAYIAYPVKDSTDEILVATTRPETLFGDVAIAVHPDDERYARYIGQKVWHILRETYIPVIADSLVDRNFGTGAVKITPAHNHLDYTIARNHQLDVIEVIDEQGNITDAGKQFKNLPRFIAREKVLNELSNRGALKKICDHKMSIPMCLRSSDIIEYMLKEQWFIKSENMARKAIESVKQNRLKIVPDTHEELWYNWLCNIRDWCVSRQLWWGHSIPAYYFTVRDKTEWVVARTESDAQLLVQNKYGPGIKLYPDPDVLDTWFSSAILPFTVLGWPKKTTEFEKYYPLTLMETGYDIIFFWVARMVMLGLELTDQLPFNEVLLHGILCDAHGKKMSKTVGNTVSPENIINGITLNDLAAELKENYNKGTLSKVELQRMLSGNKKMFPKGIPECGADALRMTLCSHNIKNPKINFDIMECRTNKFFCNKIWQASKYVILMTGEKLCQEPKNMMVIDRWILSRLSALITTVNDAFTQRDFHKAVASIKQFLYYEFCDFYLEATKLGFKTESSDIIASHTYTLRRCLEVSLRLLAPVTPYLADDLYKRLSNKFPEFLSLPSLMEAPYPASEEFNEWRDITLDKKMQEVLNIIFEIRSFMGIISKKSNLEVHIVIKNYADFIFYNETINLIKNGSKLNNISVFLENDYTESRNSISYPAASDCILFVVAEDLSILDKVKNNLDKKVSKQKGNVML